MIRFRMRQTGTLTEFPALVGTIPERYADALRAEAEPVTARLLDQLRVTPPRPRYPLRWTSERQRRFVMAKLREQGDLPYRRTGAYAGGYRIDARIAPRRGSVTLRNETPYAPFVGGRLDTGAWQQGFHVDTGWPTAAPSAERASIELIGLARRVWRATTGRTLTRGLRVRGG